MREFVPSPPSSSFCKTEPFVPEPFNRYMYASVDDFKSMVTLLRLLISNL